MVAVKVPTSCRHLVVWSPKKMSVTVVDWEAEVAEVEVEVVEVLRRRWMTCLGRNQLHRHNTPLNLIFDLMNESVVVGIHFLR